MHYYALILLLAGVKHPEVSSRVPEQKKKEKKKHLLSDNMQ